MSNRLEGKVAVITGASGALAGVETFDADGWAGTHRTVDGGLTIGPRHARDPNAAGPMTDALGLSPAELRALRAARGG